MGVSPVDLGECAGQRHSIVEVEERRHVVMRPSGTRRQQNCKGDKNTGSMAHAKLLLRFYAFNTVPGLKMFRKNRPINIHRFTPRSRNCRHVWLTMGAIVSTIPAGELARIKWLNGIDGWVLDGRRFTSTLRRFLLPSGLRLFLNTLGLKF